MPDDLMALARCRERRFFQIVVGLMTGLVIAAIAVGLASGWNVERDDGPVVVALLFGIPLGATVVMVTAYWFFRRRGVWWLQTSPVWAVSPADRRRIRKSMLAGDQLAGDEQTIAVDLARRVRVQVWILTVLVSIWSLGAVLQLFGGDLRDVLVSVTILLVGVVVLGVTYRDARRARHFLAASTSETGSSDLASGAWRTRNRRVGKMRRAERD